MVKLAPLRGCRVESGGREREWLSRKSGTIWLIRASTSTTWRVMLKAWELVESLAEWAAAAIQTT